ncbi:hypothetical protein H4Q26_001322 [Puccinia striiformis f. sp. tritici PST-130]|nr:hypothetical protein H4Q26_001322 [Puccinia striiformis f. sp. tritici PST-130]
MNIKMTADGLRNDPVEIQLVEVNALELNDEYDKYYSDYLNENPADKILMKRGEGCQRCREVVDVGAVLSNEG